MGFVPTAIIIGSGMATALNSHEHAKTLLVIVISVFGIGVVVPVSSKMVGVCEG